jgi:hypothetical protein
MIAVDPPTVAIYKGLELRRLKYAGQLEEHYSVHLFLTQGR